MVQVSRRAGAADSALVRLLARLTQAEVAEPKQAFADRLSQWVGWTDAIALGSVLDGPAATASPSPPPAATRPVRSLRHEEAECRHVRSELVRAIAQEAKPPPQQQPPMRGARPMPAPAPVEPEPVDFASWRRRHAARQQAMDSAIGPLRARLRARLAARAPEAVRLAGVDAVMEQAMAERERSLLARLPGALEAHFARLRQTALPTSAPTGEAPGAPTEAQTEPPEPPPGPWLDQFRQDMQALLLAELEFRWQPIEGLLEALRHPQAGSND